MTTAPSPHPRSFTLEEAAKRLNVPEGDIRDWLASFRWERCYDGAGHILLADRDLEFLRLIKSLKEVDRTCESIVRLIAKDPEPPPDDHTEVTALEPPSTLEQFETLKAELRVLHAQPQKLPFWRRWLARFFGEPRHIIGLPK